MENSKKHIIYIGIGIVAVSILSLYFFTNPSDVNFFPECLFHKFTGYHCPGCGSQRAIHDLLRGNILQALSHNILIITLVVGTLMYLFKRTLFDKIIYHPKSPDIFGLRSCTEWYHCT